LLQRLVTALPPLRYFSLCLQGLVADAVEI
jgi:hypothetical protein